MIVCILYISRILKILLTYIPIHAQKCIFKEKQISVTELCFISLCFFNFYICQVIL